MSDDKHVLCGRCSQRTKMSKTIPCVCKNADFCSEKCKAAGHSGCKGERKNWSYSLGDIDMKAFNDEPDKKLISREMERYPEMFSDLFYKNVASNLSALAEGIKRGEGKPGDCFMMACMCGSRMQGASSSEPDSNLFSAKSEHETNSPTAIVSSKDGKEAMKEKETKRSVRC